MRPGTNGPTRAGHVTPPSTSWLVVATATIFLTDLGGLITGTDPHGLIDDPRAAEPGLKWHRRVGLRPSPLGSRPLDTASDCGSMVPGPGTRLAGAKRPTSAHGLAGSLGLTRCRLLMNLHPGPFAAATHESCPTGHCGRARSRPG